MQDDETIPRAETTRKARVQCELWVVVVLSY